MGSASGTHTNAGGVLADTGAGAAAGASIGGPYGAAIGGAAGFLTGLLTSKSPDDPLPPEAPPAPLDLADELARRGEIAKQMRLMGDGAGNFLTGPLGDTSKAPGAAPKAVAA